MPEDNLQIFKNWLKLLSAQLGVELALDSDGICAFIVGEKRLITLEVSRDFPAVYLYSPLMALPEGEEAATPLMFQALQLNAFQAVTRGGSIALIPDSRALIFCYCLNITGIDADAFCEILSNFIETAEDIQQMLTAEKSAFPEAELPASPLIAKQKGSLMIKI